MEKLRARLAELADLEGLDMLATWDQLVMMPSEGATNRAHQLGTLARLTHERATATEIGRWLDQLEERELDGIDGDIVRLARRDWERARRVPAALAAERSSAHAEAQQCWERARWRVDVSAHPFTAWIGQGDTRLTTRYGEGEVESLLSSLHEFGHALYERQIDPALERTNLGHGTSMSMHESQSKLWENHVARSPAFAEVLAAELGAAGFPVAPGELHATLTGVEPSLIRVSADPLTYPLHIILSFQLDVALIEGDVAVTAHPAPWPDGMRRLLGLEVHSAKLGC